MKGLTLRHPWAFAIAHWGKQIENRTWKPPKALIGQRIAIHGGKVPTSHDALADIKYIFEDLKSVHGEPSYQVDGNLTLRDILLSGVVATAVIDRVIYLEAFRARNSDPAFADPWFDIEVDGNVGWVLRDVIVLPTPIPCKGAQGLWDVPDSIAKVLQP